MTTFDDWLEAGRARGWASRPVCSTHEGLPTTEAEDLELDDGGDPCMPALRLWGPAGEGEPEPRPYRLRMRFSSSGLHGKTGRLWLNDVEVSSRTVGLELITSASTVTRAVVTFLVDELELDGETILIAERHS